MTGIKALSLWQPWASLVRPDVKTIETRSWSTSYRGWLIIHAAKRWHRGAWPEGLLAAVDELCGIASYPDALPLGAIVATARLVDCVPMVQFLSRGPGDEPDPAWTPCDGPEPPMPCLAINSDTTSLTLHRPYRDVTDQLPFGDYRPGRFAWLLDDIKPTAERCPDCAVMRGVAIASCWTCHGVGRCDPIPARGRQGLWTWTPEVAA